MLRKNRKTALPLILVFSVISAFSLFMNGDDYLWFFSGTDKDLASWTMANGRIFSNKVTVLLTRNIPFRIVFVALTLSFLLFFLVKIMEFHKTSVPLRSYLFLSLVVLIPCRTYKQTILWISGFTNYVFSVAISVAFLYFVFKCIFDDWKPKALSSVVFLISGFIGGLCVEHITIYNVVMGIVSSVFILKLKKKGSLHSLMYLTGSVCACFFMFSNKYYSDIYSGSDSVGERVFKFEFSDIYQNALSNVALHYTKDFWIIPVIISLCFTILYYRRTGKLKNTDSAKICLSICLIYSGYSVFTSCFSDLRPINENMKTVVSETVFSFMYVISVVYLTYCFLEKDGIKRAFIYLISSLLVTLPFIFLSPVSPRCFFANYIFWILFAGELFCFTFNAVKKKKAVDLIENAMRLVALSLVFMISFVSLSNRYFDDLRYDYIREQLDSGVKNINIMALPYTEYTSDDLEEGLLVVSDIYFKYRLMYHGFNYDGIYENIKKGGYVEVKTSTYDYYMEKSR